MSVLNSNECCKLRCANYASRHVLFSALMNVIEEAIYYSLLCIHVCISN